MRIGRPIGDACVELASNAELNKNSFLAHLLRIAAIEAYDTDCTYFSPTHERVLGVWYWNLVEDRLYSDARCALLFGLDPKHGAIGMAVEDWITLVNKEDQKYLRQEVARAIDTGAPFDVQYRTIQDDELRWMHAKGICSYDDAKQPIRFAGTIEDITDDKDQDQAVSLSPCSVNQG
jgi:PAS domain-containing protein